MHFGIQILASAATIKYADMQTLGEEDHLLNSVKRGQDGLGAMTTCLGKMSTAASLVEIELVASEAQVDTVSSCVTGEHEEETFPCS